MGRGRGKQPTFVHRVRAGRRWALEEKPIPSGFNGGEELVWGGERTGPHHDKALTIKPLKLGDFENGDRGVVDKTG